MNDKAADSGGPVLLKVENLTVRFGRQSVLRKLSLDVRKGETLAIIGESGCGKTVLLKTIVALIRPRSGRVLFDGQNLHELNDKELTKQRLRFGFVFQQAALFDSLNVFENVAFAMREYLELSDQVLMDEDRLDAYVLASQRFVAGQSTVREDLAWSDLLHGREELYKRAKGKKER